MARDSVTLKLDYTPPLDWGFFLAYLGRRLTTGVETLDNDWYSRAIEIDGETGTISLSHSPHRAQIVVTIRGEVRRHSPAIGERVRRMFDLDLDPATVRSALGADPWIGQLLAARPGIRVPGAWSAFELLVRTIVGQQVSVQAGTTIMGRIASRFGRTVASPDGATPLLLFPSPATLADCNLDSIGMPGKRISALRSVARAIADGAIRLPDSDGSAPGVKEALLALPGIGPWTVEYFALRGLRDADAWPGSDLVLRRAVEQNPRMAEAWRPYRAYAAMHLWHQAATGPSR